MTEEMNAVRTIIEKRWKEWEGEVQDDTTATNTTFYYIWNLFYTFMLFFLRYIKIGLKDKMSNDKEGGNGCNTIMN